MEQEKSEKSRDVIRQVVNFGLLTEGPECRERIPGADTQFAAKWTPPHYLIYHSSVEQKKTTLPLCTTFSSRSLNSFITVCVPFPPSDELSVTGPGVGNLVDRVRKQKRKLTVFPE